MNLELKNKVALVSAATAGLGFATAYELVKEGAKVVICGRSERKLTEAINKLHSNTHDQNQVLAIKTDVTDSRQINSLMRQTISQFGQLDILITNVGGPPEGSFEHIDLSAWETAFNQILMSCVNLIRSALPYLAKSTAASILTVTSLTAKQPIPGMLLSNVFRPAILGLTKTLSLELGPAHIRVNSILPGWTETDRVQELLSKDNYELAKKQIIDKTPLRRIAKPEEFAKVATFLVSPAASFITGAMLQVDGGICSGLL